MENMIQNRMEFLSGIYKIMPVHEAVRVCTAHVRAIQTEIAREGYTLARAEELELRKLILDEVRERL